MNFCIPSWITVSLQQSEPHWSTILTGSLAPIVALLGALIAYQQWKTARNKLKLDLYEKRLSIYEAIKEAIHSILTNGKVTPETRTNFLIGIRGARWLFNKKMFKYIDEALWNEILELENIQIDLNSLDASTFPCPERDILCNKKTSAMMRLNEHLRSIDKKFHPFLSLRH